MLPLAAALGLVLGIGFVAEHKSRALALQTERAGASAELETVRAGLESAFGRQIDVLSRIAGAVAWTPDIDQASFAEITATLGEAPGPILSLVAAPAETGQLFVAGTPAKTGTVANILAAASRDAAGGARGLVDADRPCLLIWKPVFTGIGDRARFWGHVAAIIDTEALFDAAGLHDPAIGLELALTAAETGLERRGRAVHLGNSGAIAADPVTARIGIPGGNWELAALPKSGWRSDASAVWPIRLLTLLSLGLVAAPMLRTRRLLTERHRNIRDLSEREVELARLSQRLGLALDASKVGVWDFNIDTDRLIWDSRMDELYGYTPGDRPRQYSDWRDRLHPEDRSRAEREFREAVNESGRYVSDYRILLPDGTLRHVRAMAEMFPAADGQSSMVGVNWDVTADVRRQVELETRRREAEDALLVRSQFLATMSHEIRTPMGGVLGLLELLLAGDLSTEQRRRATLVRDSARHLLEIVNDVLDLSKLDADRIVLDRMPVDAAQLARDVVALMSAATEGGGLTVFASIEGDFPHLVLSDPARLRQILANLVGNAVKFTEAGTVELRLGYDRSGQALTVEVRDTGVGISVEAMPHLFERYSQIGRSPDLGQHRGTGLGLAICRELVEKMGGTISAESTPGRGSTFGLRIPAPPVPAPGRVRENPAVASDTTAPAARSLRILAAEDNRTDRTVLAGYLEMAGHDVTFVTNGAEAMDALQAADFDLVILDVTMPVMDGLETVREIRARGVADGVPVLAITGQVTAEDRARTLDAGMDALVTKPIAVDDLFGAIERVSAAYSSTGAQPSPGSKLSIAPPTSSVSSPRSAS